MQFGHDRAHALTERTDTGPFRVQARHLRAHRDLGAVTCFASQRNDFDRPVSDLGHLEREQLAHQTRMRARQRDLRTAHSLVHLHDVAANARAVFVALARHLFASRQHGFDLAQVDENVPRIVLLLDHAADDVTFAPGVLAERQLVLGVAQPLQDDLLGRAWPPPG